MRAKLMALQKHRVQLMYVNQLGKPLAETLYQAFVKAGWGDRVTLSDGGGNHFGIIAGVGIKMAGAIKEAIEGSTRLKISLNKPNEPDWGI